VTASLRLMPGPAPDPAAGFGLEKVGYAEQEFRLDGSAESYELVGERAPDGAWTARPSLAAPFTTRVLARQPADQARFSGTVFVEWLNVSAGIDAAPDWLLTHTHLVRRGHAWAGVSAQKAGIDGGGIVEGLHLKKMHPERYSVLSHPGDAWSFDIFSQAGHALRSHPGVLPAPLSARPLRLLATGHSQSAAFLVTYINTIHSFAAVYDGFLVHGRPGAAAALDTGFKPGRGTRGAGELIRADPRVPVLVLQAETDVALLGSSRARQPDTERLRLWELAGAAHADTYMLAASWQDDGGLSAQRLADLMKPTTNLVLGRTDQPANSGPQHHYVQCAAVEQLDEWVAGRSAPPSAPRLEVTSDDGGDLRRDSLGIALGGIRTPWTDVPSAVLSGTGQTGELFAFLLGTTRELTVAELERLYPGGKGDYIGRFEHSLDDVIAAGFLLSEDRAEILGVAAASWPG
jgi:hypothetical protein